MRITNILIVAVITCVLVAFGYEVGIVHERYLKPEPKSLAFTGFADQPPWPKGDKVECGQILQDGRIVRWEEPGPWCHSVMGVQ